MKNQLQNLSRRDPVADDEAERRQRERREEQRETDRLVFQQERRARRRTTRNATDEDKNRSSTCSPPLVLRISRDIADEQHTEGDLQKPNRMDPNRSFPVGRFGRQTWCDQIAEHLSENRV